MTDRKNAAHYVYRYYDSDDCLLYVGCTHAPFMRRRAHSRNSSWYPQAVRVRHTVFPDRRTALDRELDAIRDEKPKHNVKGRWTAPRDHWELVDYHSFLWALVESVNPDKPPVSAKTRRTINAVIDEAHDRFGVVLLGRAA